MCGCATGAIASGCWLVARDFYAQPAANIPQACQSRAKTKAAYRLFEHKAVKMDAILASHYHSTMERIAREKIPVVLAVQDTTSFNYNTHADMEGLGPINKHVDGAQGILMHDTMAYTTEGTAMGLVDIQVWARDPKQFGKRVTRYERPIEQKESYKWLRSFQGAARLQRQLGAATTVVSVGDREADIYELFLLAQKDPCIPSCWLEPSKIAASKTATLTCGATCKAKRWRASVSWICPEPRDERRAIVCWRCALRRWSCALLNAILRCSPCVFGPSMSMSLIRLRPKKPSSGCC